jgi:hypothetical protein
MYQAEADDKRDCQGAIRHPGGREASFLDL